MPGGLGVWIVGAVLIGFMFVLISRYAHRDSSVKSTRFGFYVERNRYDEGEVWTVDPLPPRPEDLPTQEWPKREEKQ